MPITKFINFGSAQADWRSVIRRAATPIGANTFRRCGLGAVYSGWRDGQEAIAAQ
jgi:hypothetical protein